MHAVLQFAFTQSRVLRLPAPNTITADDVIATWNVEFKLLHALMKQIRAGNHPIDKRFEDVLNSIDPFTHHKKAQPEVEAGLLDTAFSLPPDRKQDSIGAMGKQGRESKRNRKSKDTASNLLGASRRDKTIGEIVEEGKTQGLTAAQALKAEADTRRTRS